MKPVGDKPKRESALQYKKKYEKLKSKKRLWHDLYQAVGEFAHGKKVDFTTTTQPGSFLNRELFDSTGPKSAKKMASSLIGLLWQNGGKSIIIEAPEELKNPKREETDFYKQMSSKIAEAYDDPRSGFPLVLEEYMFDQTTFGTSGIFTDDGEKYGTLLRFKAVGVESWCFAEGANGQIDTAYGEMKKTIENAAKEYGLESLSKKTQDLYRDGKGDDEITILHAIEPRVILDPQKAGNQFMPYKSVHIELSSDHIIKESGYEEMPAGIVRFSKRIGEEYGRSPAMDALPDILTLNQVREDRLVANEKRLEPPLGMYSDSLLGTNEIDTSPRGINIFNPQGKMNGKSDPVWPLYAVGDINAADAEIADLKQSITEHFYLDRLLDFNNQAKMTLGEAQMRQQIRGEGILPLVMRQAFEGFISWIDRGVAILYRKGEFGVVPGSDLDLKMRAIRNTNQAIPERIAQLILSGKEFYKIKFVTPAARLMQAEEAQGTLKVTEYVFQLLQAYPEARDLLDVDEAINVAAKAFGSPNGVIRDKKAVDEIRKANAESQQAQAMAQAQATQNELDRGGAEADLMANQAMKQNEAM